MLDLYSRRVVGWAMSDRMTSDLTTMALEMALLQRRPGAGLIHHSDQGSQYTDQAYQLLLKEHEGFQASYAENPEESKALTAGGECAQRVSDMPKVEELKKPAAETKAEITATEPTENTEQTPQTEGEE